MTNRAEKRMSGDAGAPRTIDFRIPIVHKTSVDCRAQRVIEMVKQYDLFFFFSPTVEGKR